MVHNVDIIAMEALLKQVADKIRHFPGWKLQVFVLAHVWEGKVSSGHDFLALESQNIDKTPQIYIPPFSIFQL